MDLIKAVASPDVFGRAVDLSEEVNLVPNRWGVLNRLGLFINEHKTQRTVLWGISKRGDIILEDKPWGERSQAAFGRETSYVSVNVPHFPVDDAITPDDIQGRLDIRELVQDRTMLKTLNAVRADKMEILRESHSLTLEYARFKMIQDGTVYAPNETVQYNVYDMLGQTRVSESAGLTSTTDNPLRGFSDLRALVQNGLHTGDVVTGFVALCSRTFFNALVTNEFVYESYAASSLIQGNGIPNQRIPTGFGLDPRYEVFHYGGISFICVDDVLNGEPLVKDGEAYLLALGTRSFKTFFAPADRLSLVNTVAKESYLWEFRSDKDDIIELASETNFINVMQRPQAVITLTV